MAKVLSTTVAAIPAHSPNGTIVASSPQLTSTTAQTATQTYRGLVGTVSTIVKQEGPRWVAFDFNQLMAKGV